MYKQKGILMNISEKVLILNRVGGEWTQNSTKDLYEGKKIVTIGLPGAFTPTCSSTHLPGYDKAFSQFKDLGIDAVYCVSVNDAFVMNAWAANLEIQNITMVPDGNGDFTRSLDMMVWKKNLGFGERSWRYSMYTDGLEIVKVFEEPGKEDNCPTDPFEVSDAATMLAYLRESLG